MPKGDHILISDELADWIADNADGLEREPSDGELDPPDEPAAPRNCDVLSEEAANEAWGEYRRSHVLPRGGWDFRHIIRWLFAPAEGVAKCVNGLRGDPDCRGCEEHCEDVRRRNCINWSGDHCAKTKGIFCPVSCDEFRAYKPAEGDAE